MQIGSKYLDSATTQFQPFVQEQILCQVGILLITCQSATLAVSEKPVLVVVFWSRKSPAIGLVSVSARARQILVEIFIAYTRFYTILFTPPITKVNI